MSIPHRRLSVMAAAVSIVTIFMAFGTISVLVYFSLMEWHTAGLIALTGLFTTAVIAPLSATLATALLEERLLREARRAVQDVEEYASEPAQRVQTLKSTKIAQIRRDIVRHAAEVEALTKAKVAPPDRARFAGW